jgi:ribosomal protein S18 acetylase RimI-like enzyme
MSDTYLSSKPVVKGIHSDTWLTVMLKCPVYRLSAEEIFNSSEFETEKDQVVRLQSKPVFIYSKIPTGGIPVSRWLEEIGFYLVDTNVVFDKPAAKNCLKDINCIVRPAQPGDRSAVMDLALRNFEYSRFHLDPNISIDCANAVKAEWVGNFFAGQRGDSMVVALAEDTVAGFLQLIHGNNDDLIVDLIAVNHAHRGKGLATAMICYAENHANKSLIVVGTQVTNVPSVRLYQKLGFRMRSSQYIFHYHNLAQSYEETTMKEYLKLNVTSLAKRY